MAIKAIATDVDGVLTDGTVWLDERGTEQKRVSFTDIMGVSLGRRAGLIFALISGEGGPCLDSIATKFGVTQIYPGCKDKAAALAEFASANGLEMSEVCFMGDDVNDLAALDACGLAAAPADAHPSVFEHATLITRAPGGKGAMRELVDKLLADGAHAVSSAKESR